jgi:epoxide hydrolase 4
MIRHAQVALPNGITLHTAACGDPARPLMLMLHGFPEFWAAWESVLPLVSTHFHAVAPDMRGYNLSSMPEGVSAYRAKHLVEDIKLLVEALGYRECVLVAHDWGGAVAWNAAVALPAMVKKLVIINSPHPETFRRGLAEDPVQQKASAYMNWLRAEGSEARLAENNFAKMKQFLTGTGQNVSWFTPQVEAQYQACWARGLTGAVNYYRASPLFPPTETEEGARGVTFAPAFVTVLMPTLVIWGMADTALPASLLDGLGRYVPQMQLEQVPGATHWIAHEQPARVAQLILQFAGASA